MYRNIEGDFIPRPLEEDYHLNEEKIFDDETSYNSAWLLEKQEFSTGQKHMLTSQEFTIGCAPDTNITIDDERLSDYHFRIKRENGRYLIYDLISDAGTYLNGKKLLRPRVLYDWDEISAAGYQFIFRGTTLQKD